MFDWNDEELTNIIWDEAGESDDHTVPFLEAGEDYSKKKGWSQEAGLAKSTEQKQAGVNVRVHERKLKSSSNFDSIEGTSMSGFSIDSWPKLSVTNTCKKNKDSLDTSVSNNLTDITKFDSSGGETAQLNKDTEIFQDNSEGKEQGDFVDYGWANIGSFDDLDRIFSNDDPIFGNVRLGSTDELWNSSKISNSPVKSFPLSDDSPGFGYAALRNTSESLEVKTDFVQGEEQPFNLHYGRLGDPSSHGFQTARPVLDRSDYAGCRIKTLANDPADLSSIGKNDTPANSQITAENVEVSNELADKAYKQKKTLKNRKKHEEKNELKQYQDVYGNWSASGNPSDQFKNQFSPSMVQSPTSSVLIQQRSLQGPASLQYQKISNPFVTPSGYGSITNPYSGMPVMSDIQSGDLTRQPLLSGYDVSSRKANSVNKSADSMVNSQTMTPQEKIEKLRRRQQLQAMLAIQKQQQQLGHKVSGGDPSMTQKCPQDNQIQNVGVSDLEVDDLSAFPSFDPNSPIEQDDSNTVSLVVQDYSLEDTVLYQLQEIISKVDVRIRICIRDSLFRLAQSATQRHYASDTSSTNNNGRDEQVSTKEDAANRGRSANMPEVETETNPIDRTVAHLLFHRSLESSGKLPDTPESPVSPKLPSDPMPISATKLSVGGLHDNKQTKQNFSQASKHLCPLVDPQPISQSKSSICISASENASSIGPVDEETREVEASQ